jgi:hypothetical protein
LEVACEALEARMSAGEQVDLDSYGRAASHLRRILETLGIERKPTAPYLEAHVVGTPWSPMSARLKAEAEAVAVAAKEGAEAADVSPANGIEHTATPASLRGQREGIS